MNVLKLMSLAWFHGPARPQELRPWSTPSSKHAAVEARESTGHERSKQGSCELVHSTLFV